MKNFGIKHVLVLVLALVLVLTLVACDKNKNKPVEPEEPASSVTNIKATDYFDKLWKATSSLNDTAFAEGDDLGLNLDLGLELKGGDSTLLSLGIRADLVVDRLTAAEAAAVGAQSLSAARVSIYNQADGSNYLTLYYFLDNPDLGYVEFGGQKFKVNFDFGANDTWAATFQKFLSEPRLDLDSNKVNETSILQVVENILLQGAGKDWNLDVMLGNALNTIPGFDFQKLMESDIMKALLGDKGGEAANLSDLIKVASPILFKSNSACQEIKVSDTEKYYKATVEGSIAQILGGFLKTGGIDLGGLITSRTLLSLGYTMKGEEIDGFDITAVVPRAYGSQDFTAKISINDLTISKLDVPAGKKLGDIQREHFGFNEANYSDTYALNLGFDLVVPEGAILMTIPNGDQVVKLDLAGTYRLDLNVTLDLLNKGAANTSKLYAEVKYNNTKQLALAYSAANDEAVMYVANTPLGIAEAAGKDLGLKDVFSLIVNVAMKDTNPDKASLLNLLAQNTDTYYSSGVDFIYVLKQAVVNASKKASGSSEEIATAQAEKAVYVPIPGTEGHYYNVNQTGYPFLPSVKGIISAVANLLTVQENGLTFNVGKGALTKVITSGVFSQATVNDYTYDGKEYKQSTSKYSINSATDFEAIVFATSGSWLRKFTDAGYLPTYELDGKACTMKGNMLTKEQATFMYNVAMGKVTYDDWKAKVGEANTLLEEEKYNEFVDSFIFAQCKKMFAGSFFLDGDDSNGGFLVDLLDRGDYSLGVSFANDTLSVDVKATCGNKGEAKLGLDLGAKAGGTVSGTVAKGDNAVDATEFLTKILTDAKFEINEKE